MEKERLTYQLNKETISIIWDKLDRYCSEKKMSRRQSMRYKLTVDDCLVTWLQNFQEEKEVAITTGRRLNQSYFSVEIAGEKLNPFDVEDEEEICSEMVSAGNHILLAIGLAPKYSYRRGVNRLTFYVDEKTMNPALQLLLAVLAATVVGVAGRLILPMAAITFITGSILQPIYETFFRALTCIAEPMIFISMVWGIIGVGDVRTFKNIGLKMSGRIVGIVTLCTLCALCYLPFIDFDLSSSESSSSQVKVIVEMILDIIPENIFSPFISGNMLQILFMAVVIGTVTIFLGEKAEGVANVVEITEIYIQNIMRAISDLIPIFIFVIVLNMTWAGKLSVYLPVLKLFIVFVILCLVLLLISIGYTAMKHKVSPVLYFRKCFRPYSIAFAAASSAAALEAAMDVCTQKLGIDRSLTSFGIPFSVVTFKPYMGLYYGMVCIAFGEMYDIQFSLQWIIMVMFLSVVCAIASPPIPGGCLVAYSIMFLQLGIPSEALGTIASVDIIFDFFISSGTIMASMLELSNIALNTGKQNMNILKN